MKLQLVPARTGIVWVKLGIQTFFRQPLALSGLFFMFLAVMSLAGMVPVIGLALALALAAGLHAGPDGRQQGGLRAASFRCRWCS